MVIKVKGTLDFRLPDVTKKHKKQDWKKVAIIKTKCDIDNYYAWFLEKRFNLEFVKNLRGAHVTIISDKMDSEIFEQASKIFDGKEITFFYEIEPKTNNKHWWLRVHCPEAEAIRSALGLSKEPYFEFHLTIGYVNEKNLAHSKYVNSLIKFHNILNNETRQPLNTHEIISFDQK